MALSLLLVLVVVNGYQIVKLELPNNEYTYGINAEYSENFDNNADMNAFLVKNSGDMLGCNKWESIITRKHAFGIVKRGECAFTLKSINAKKAGLIGLFIINDKDEVIPMSGDKDVLKDIEKPLIPTIMISNKYEDKLLNMKTINITVYKSKYFDFGMILMCLIAVIIVGFGAYYSSDLERSKYYNFIYGNKALIPLKKREQTQVLNETMASMFIIMASFGLIIMYFFVEYLFYMVIIVFCFGAINGLGSVFSHVLDMYYKELSKNIYYISSIETDISMSDIIGYGISLGLTIFWYMFRHYKYSYILQDIMCFGLLMSLQRTIQLPNLKISSILLVSAFFYDIFWVFLSPYFFEKNVMVKVATYEHKDASTKFKGLYKNSLPVVIILPKFNSLSIIEESPMILGLGDMALPGLLISFLLKFDYKRILYMTKKSIKLNDYGYFIPCIIGYGIGMILTDINLILMQHGQPALLFLVPSTLGVAIYLGWKRNELNMLWNGYEYETTKDTLLQ